MTEIESATLEEEQGGLSKTTSKALQMMNSTLDWAYDSALNGVPGLGTIEEFIASYQAQSSDPEDAIRSLIRWQTAKAGTSGFVTGLGGIITLPAAIPANLASVIYLQLRMITGIAQLRGYDIRSDQVRTMCIACLAGSAVADILKEVGVKLGTKMTQQAIMRISGATLIRINKAVGFRLVTKAGSKGIFNLTKMVPFVGGFVGGTFDVVTTRGIAAAADSLFIRVEAEVSDLGLSPLGSTNLGMPVSIVDVEEVEPPADQEPAHKPIV